MIESHLENCETCQAIVESYDTYADPLLRTLTAPSRPDLYAAEPQLAAALRLLKERPLDFGEVDALDPVAPVVPVALGGPGQLPVIRDYELLRELGEGGMGSVYLAWHRRLKRQVALKVISPHRMCDLRAVARFEREMEAIGKLEHRNIVRALDAGEHERTHYLVMEYVVGETFSDLLHRHGPLRVADACELVRQAADGLQYAHEHGFVHRDIKPSNLMLSRDGVVKVLDLGLARFLRSQEDELTADGQVLGTRDYMAPEQMQNSRQAEIRADIYSLGCTLFRLLVGRLPPGLRDPSAGVPNGSAEGDMAGLLQGARPEVPDELAHYVASIMAVLPADRPATPRDVAEILARFADGSNLTGLLAERTSDQAPPSRDAALPAASRRSLVQRTPRSYRWYLGVLTLLLAVAGGAWYAFDRRVERGSSGIEPAPAAPTGRSAEEAQQRWLAARRALELGGVLALHDRDREISLPTELPAANELRVQKVFLREIELSAPQLRSLLLPLGHELRFLRLQRLAELPDDTVRLIASFRQLKGLYLEETPLTDEQLAQLQTLTELRALRIDTTPVTDRSIATLCTFTQLESLGVRGTRITSAGIKQLQAALPNCEIKYSNP